MKGNTRILIIEDNAAFRASLRTLLCSRSDGIEIIEAEDGREALWLTHSFRPDLVFVDIQLPGQTGLAVTRDLKQSVPALPVVILTSYDLPEYRDAAIRCGADYFFGKDTSSTEEILGFVERHLQHPA